LGFSTGDATGSLLIDMKLSAVTPCRRYGREILGFLKASFSIMVLAWNRFLTKTTMLNDACKNPGISLPVPLVQGVLYCGDI
jgi:hypothetical protein